MLSSVSVVELQRTVCCGRNCFTAMLCNDCASYLVAIIMLCTTSAGFLHSAASLTDPPVFLMSYAVISGFSPGVSRKEWFFFFFFFFSM